jgi:hypothetical protein
MDSNSAQPLFSIDLDRLQEAKRIIRSVQRDTRQALRLLAVLEDLHVNGDKEEKDNENTG